MTSRAPRLNITSSSVNAVTEPSKVDKSTVYTAYRLKPNLAEPETAKSPVTARLPQDKGATATVKLPVSVATFSVVPKINVSTDSSHPIKALFPVVPRSINIPESFALAPVNPLFNSSSVSLIVVFVVLIVVVSPETIKLPCIDKLLALTEVTHPLSLIIY